MTSREAFEISFKRPRNFLLLSAEEQWNIDKALGILDWDGAGLELTDEDRVRISAHYIRARVEQDGKQK